MTSNSLLPALAAALDNSATSDMYLHSHHTACADASRGDVIALVELLAKCLGSVGELFFELHSVGVKLALLLNVFFQSNFQFCGSSAAGSQFGSNSLWMKLIRNRKKSNTQNRTLISSCIADFSADHCRTQSSRSTLRANSSSFLALISLANLNRSSALRPSNSTLHTCTSKSFFCRASWALTSCCSKDCKHNVMHLEHDNQFAQFPPASAPQKLPPGSCFPPTSDRVSQLRASRRPILPVPPQAFAQPGVSDDATKDDCSGNKRVTRGRK